MAKTAAELIQALPKDTLQKLLDENDTPTDVKDSIRSYLNPKGEAEVGPAILKPSTVEPFGNSKEPVVPEHGQMVAAVPPRSDLPLAEPTTYKGQSQPDEPRSAAQLLSGGDAGGLAIPTDTPQTQHNPMAGDINVSENKATYDALARSQQPTQPPPGGAGDVLAGVNLNAPEVRTNTQTSQAIMGPDVKEQYAKSDAALQRQMAAEQQRAAHLAQAGADKAKMQEGYADQLKAGNDAYQAKVTARQEQVAGVERERAAASQAYQDEVKNAPLGTMLNPTAAQAMGSAIAQALGAFGAGMSHSPNAALAILDKQLDAAQHERQTRIQGKAFQVRMADRHLQDLRDIFHDDDAAHLAWKADQFDLFSARLAKQATLTGNQDIIDQAAIGQEAAQVKAADLRAQSLQAFSKHVATSTSSESGPMVALKAAEAKLKMMKESKGGAGITVPYEKFDAWKNKSLAANDILRGGVQNIPDAIQRVNAQYGSDVASWSKAAASGFAGVNLTDAQKDALSGTFRLMNAEILDQTGKAMTENEAGRIKLGLGFADFSSPADVMRAVRRIGQKLQVDRATMTAANPAYADAFAAYDQVSAAPPSGPNGKVYGPLSGQ